MKNINFIIAAGLSLSMGLYAADGIAQSRVIAVPQGVGTLNNTIDADTTETGARIDPLNTVYELQDGGTYILTRTITNAADGTFPLHIRTAPGYSEPAFLQPTPGDGGESARPFRISNHLTIEGLHVTGRDQIGGLTTNIIRINSNDTRIIVDRCILEEDGQALFRQDGSNSKVYFTNSYVQDMGQPVSIDNGRVWDDRGNDTDTLWFENNTVVNVTSRFVRNGGNGTMNYAYFDQNTWANAGTIAFDFGAVSELIFTNNMMVNSAFLGETVNPDLAGLNIQAVDGQQVTISHNNWHYTNDVLEAIDGAGDREPVPFLNELAADLVDDSELGDTNISEVVTFENPAVSPLSILQADIAGNTVNEWDTENAPYSYAYEAGNGEASFVGGTNGQPIGAGGATLSSNGVLNVNPLTFYPNPTTDQVIIQLENSRVTTIEIFSLDGKMVKATQAGLSESQVQIPVNEMTNGLYIIRAIAGNEAYVGKLIKI